MNEDTRKRLGEQLIKLGDMIGDGLHHESDGKWIAKEYQRVFKALGYGPLRANNSAPINARMAQRVTEVACQNCGGTLKQTRSGSMKARCTSCKAGFTLLTIKRGKTS